MAMLPQAFDARSVQPIDPEGGQSFPVGDYPAVLTANVIRKTQNPNNPNSQSGLIEYTGQFIDGQFKGQTFKWIFNVYNENPQASEIAWRQLGSLGQVLQVFDMQNLDGCHNKPFIVCFRPHKDKPEKTRITGCMPMTAASAPAPQAAQPSWTPQQSAPPPGSNGTVAPAQAPAQWVPPGQVSTPSTQAPAPAWSGPSNAPAPWAPPGR